MKLVPVLFLLIAVEVRSDDDRVAVCKHGNVFYGCRPAPDPLELLSKQHIAVPAKFLQIVTHNYCIPYSAKVKCLKLLDQSPLDRSCVSVEVGQNGCGMLIYFSSQRSLGIRYRMEVYGTGHL